ncbi:hypothetical protein CRENBAI_007036 [Crenichthys baileyi]|uniref:Uncharacterized protein n=1 Tax=Crenichthys baileyi TaxID=28760 RepID=A0AAV9RTZ1_9TELE
MVERSLSMRENSSGSAPHGLEIVGAGRARRKEEVSGAEATAFVRQNGGILMTSFLVLAHCKIQFWKTPGPEVPVAAGELTRLRKSIWSAALWGKKRKKKPLSTIKNLFLRYTSQIREIGEAVEV